MNEKWRRIIDGLTYVKPEYINKEKIKQTLEYDRSIDGETLDSLYMMKVIDIKEYIEFLSLIIAREQENADFLKNSLEEAAKAGDKFDPMIHYGFGFDCSQIISDNIHEQFNKKFGVDN